MAWNRTIRTRRPGRPGDPDPAEAPTAARPAAPTPAEAPTEHGPAPDAGDAPTTEQPGGPRRLYRSRDERVIGGVCGGLAEYFGIDPLIVRIVAIALVFAGGAGFLAYLAAWLLVPSADGEPVATGLAGRPATIAGTVLLVLAICTILPFWNGPFGGWSWGGPLLSLVVLGLAGLALWWVASGEHPAASGTRDILRRAGFGVALLAVCGLLAIAGAWATAAGGGTIVAVVVIVAGLWLVAGALPRRRALADPPRPRARAARRRRLGREPRRRRRRRGPRVPSGGGLDEIRRTYKLGVGHLMLDLRDVKLPPGDRRIHVEIGAGAVSIAVPRDVCVTCTAHVGAGQVNVFGHGSGGLDVDWRDDRRAPPGTTRLIVDGDVGVGVLDVTYDDPNRATSTAGAPSPTASAATRRASGASVARRELDLPSLVAGARDRRPRRRPAAGPPRRADAALRGPRAAGVRDPRGGPARDGPRPPRLVRARWDHGRDDGHAPCPPRPAPVLRRDTQHRMLGGVCAGLARHLGVDPIIVRVAFVAAATAGGVGVAVYLLAWVFLPAGEAPAGAGVAADEPRDDRGRASGSAFLAAQRPARPSARSACCSRT